MADTGNWAGLPPGGTPPRQMFPGQTPPGSTPRQQTYPRDAAHSNRRRYVPPQETATEVWDKVMLLHMSVMSFLFMGGGRYDVSQVLLWIAPPS